MPFPELDTVIYKLKKRGFKQDDVFLHECPTCKEKAVAIFVISGRVGGRDIRLCVECGAAQSWRSDAGLEGRSQDENFDLSRFLR